MNLLGFDNFGCSLMEGHNLFEMDFTIAICIKLLVQIFQVLLSQLLMLSIVFVVLQRLCTFTFTFFAFSTFSTLLALLTSFFFLIIRLVAFRIWVLLSSQLCLFAVHSSKNT